jgi:hypothetical protein
MRAATQSPSAPLSIHIVAAEESGDALGAALARALIANNNAVKLSGVGGSAMAAAGIASPFAIGELSIIGLTAIPQRLPTIFRRIRETAEAIVNARPHAVVIVDSPDFTHRVARRVRALAPEIPTMCSQSCRSNRKSTANSVGRHALMSAIRWSSVSARCARARTKRGAGLPNRRSCWSCQVAVRERSRAWPAFSVKQSNA